MELTIFWFCSIMIVVGCCNEPHLYCISSTDCIVYIHGLPIEVHANKSFTGCGGAMILFYACARNNLDN